MAIVCVFGSLNMDLVVSTPRLPMPGETLIGSDFQTIPGGKGANQAVAVARLGVTTHMVGRVGADDFGRTLTENLQKEGIHVAAVQEDAQTSTGIALITVAHQGDNQIVVVSGANGQVDLSDVERLKPLLKNAQVLLLQLEIPLTAAIAAAQAAQTQGVTVILDPAPAPAVFPPELYPLVNILTPNQVEAAQLVGFAVETPEAALKTAQVLHDRGVATPIITLGAEGVVYHTGQEVLHLPALPVEAIDTTAAGDAFNGGLGAALAQGLPLSEAIRWGLAAGAIAVTRAGAQPSLGDRAEILDLAANLDANTFSV
jgi:ribokinase